MGSAGAAAAGSSRLQSAGTSSFSHYIICFHFPSSVTVRQPIRIIKTTFMQLSADSPSNIFSTGGIIPRAQMWPVSGGTWTLTASHPNCSFGRTWPVVSVMEPLPNLFLHVSLTQTKCARSALVLGIFFCHFFFFFPRPVNTARAPPLITIHLIRMQKTSSVSCDGRTGRLR